MEKLSRADLANIGDLERIHERKVKRRNFFDKKILELAAEVNVIEGEIKFWEEQIEKISGMPYKETMAYIRNKDIEEPQVEEEDSVTTDTMIAEEDVETTLSNAGTTNEIF